MPLLQLQYRTASLVFSKIRQQCILWWPLRLIDSALRKKKSLKLFTNPSLCVDALFTSNVLQWPPSGKAKLMSPTWRVQTKRNTISDCSYWLHTFSTRGVFQFPVLQDKFQPGNIVYTIQLKLKTKCDRKSSNLSFQWTNTWYQNNFKYFTVPFTFSLS